MRALAASILMVITGLAAAADQTNLPADNRYNLPSLGLPADTVLSSQQAAKLGSDVVAQMYAANYIVEDPELEDYLTRIGWRLAVTGSEHPPDFHFYPIADNEINAFALPGAYIGVNTGLMVATKTESELAAVMAHEETHVTQHHIARAAHDNRAADMATWLAMLGAILAGSTSGNPDAVIGALTVGQSINYQRQINYTRGDEMEADRIGIRKLAAAGFDPRAMAEFFQRLEVQSRLYGNQIPAILQDHPVDSVRIAEAEERAAQYPIHTVTSPLRYYLMRARARVLQTDLPADAVAYFSSKLASDPSRPEAIYGYAFALSQTGDYNKAVSALKVLLDEHPEQPNIVLLQVSLLDQLNEPAQALPLLSRLLKVYPTYTPAILAQAQTLIQDHQPGEARQVLLSSDQSFGPSVETYQLLAQAARATGNIAEAQYQMANFYAARGDLRSALDQLDAGLRLSDIRGNERDKLAARRQELIANLTRDELRDLKRQRRQHS